MFHVDTKHLAVLEVIQRGFSIFIGFGMADQPIKFLAQRGSRGNEGGIAVVLQKGQKIIVLATEEVLPEEIAGAEQAGKEGKGLLVAEKGQGFLLSLSFRLLDRQVKELVEGF